MTERSPLLPLVNFAAESPDLPSRLDGDVNDPGLILSGPEVSLETHLMTFAAEQSRREHRTIDL